MDTPEAAGAPASGPDQTQVPTQPVSRRGFVVAGAAVAGALAVGAGAFGRPAGVASAQVLSKQVVVADPSLCIGCLACEVNCSTWHASVGRSSLPRIRVMRTPDVKLSTAVAGMLPTRAGFTPQTCRHCPTAWCVPNCPTGALHVDASTGARVVNEKACIACGKCEVDCPVEWSGVRALRDQAISSKRVTYDPKTNTYAKCDLCQGRDGGPICVERCPVNAAIKSGYVKSDHPCLDLKTSTEEQWKQLT